MAAARRGEALSVQRARHEVNGTRVRVCHRSRRDYDRRMTEPAVKRRLSYADYLAQEATSAVRHELIGGELFAMAGGTRAHALVQTGVVGALVDRLRGTPCRPAGSDNRIYLPKYDEGVYADAHVVCGARVTDPADPEACTNPSVVFEVLSPSTEAWDRGGKFERYESLPSVTEYVLVTVDRVRVERFSRNPDGTWTRFVYGAGDRLPLPCVSADLLVDSLYELLAAEEAAANG
jgi:Uma2 family endonuclease